MPQDTLYPSILNLDQYDIFLEEECDNSKYIKIDKSFINDIKELKSFKSTITQAMWVVYVAVIGLISRIIWGD